MKLNADIVYENLRKQFPGEISGYRSKELILRRPEFYVENTEVLKRGHLYLMARDEFPRHLSLEKGCVIVCYCNVPNFSKYSDNACFIKLNGKPDIFSVTNAIYGIFEVYSNWDHHLSSLLETSADIDEMTSITSSLIDNPVLILDSNFTAVSNAGYTADSIKLSFGDDSSNQLSLNAMNMFLDAMDLQTANREVLHFNVKEHDILSYNLFEMDEYAGSITFDYTSKPFAPGDEALMLHFAKYVMLAMKRYTSFMTSNKSILRKVIQNIVEEIPVDDETRRQFTALQLKQSYCCLVFNMSGRASQIPVDYICEQLEIKIPNCISFPYKDNILCFIGFDSVQNISIRIWLEQILDNLVDGAAFKVGISSDFSNPYFSRLYYQQALAALENGMILDPESNYHYFRDYALTELIINAQNDLPLEMYYSDGLRKLFEHDQTSTTSYVETLRSYLNNNMSVTATSSDLHIHRSTLLERLGRIKRELWEDLDDPDVRLRLMIVLKAIELRDEIFKPEE
ncbi:MAG: helix-turn-helix domain-containing protein [Clostridia bacterium]|nr:helix-turn-helix domain-containing protein [Clostridia bacterium]